MILAGGLRHSVVGVLAAVVTSCSSSQVAPSQTNAARRAAPIDGRVLFIGNSLTEANGLPEVVETLSRQGGGTPISATSVVFYQQINGRSPVGLPPWTQMPADRALLLQEAAQEANAQFGRR
jgi:hypothetical protein